MVTKDDKKSLYSLSLFQIEYLLISLSLWAYVFQINNSISSTNYDLEQKQQQLCR